MRSLRERLMKTSKALVFDIKRFAIHDGHGIRTTVFFKGCPLQCKWCQNPEGLSSKQQPVYLKNKCIHCQRCLKASHEGQMHYSHDRPYIHFDYQGDFSNLIDACPSGAIRYDSQFYDLEELVEKIKEDKVFFQEEGGVTFSGGEPLMQGKFLVDLLKRCHEEGIHTAIETTLYVPLELIKEVLPYLDLIYIDLKIFDEQKHRTGTGVSSKSIKEHIAYVLTSEYKDKVIIRTPLIPTMTASDDNILSIARFLVGVDNDVHYELLNYNPLAPAKYEMLDKDYGLKGSYKLFTDQDMHHFYNLVYSTGLKHLVIE